MSLPPPASLLDQAWRLLSLKKTFFFTLCPSKTLMLPCTTCPHPDFALSLSLLYLIHTCRKWNFPWWMLIPFALTTTLCAGNWSFTSASSLRALGIYFQIFKEWSSVPKLRAMAPVLQNGGLPQAVWPVVFLKPWKSVTGSQRLSFQARTLVEEGAAGGLL